MHVQCVSFVFAFVQTYQIYVCCFLTLIEIEKLYVENMKKRLQLNEICIEAHTHQVLEKTRVSPNVEFIGSFKN